MRIVISVGAFWILSCVGNTSSVMISI